jgi:flagellar motor switch/type III secretory pathway protein FliN
MNDTAIQGPDVLEFVADLAGKVAEDVGRDVGVLCQRELTWQAASPEQIAGADLAGGFAGPVLIVPGKLTGELSWQGFFAMDETLAALMSALMLMTPEEELPAAVEKGLGDDEMDAFGEIANQLFASYAAACREFFEAEISPEGEPPARRGSGAEIDPARLDESMIAVRFNVEVPGQTGGEVVWAMTAEAAEAFRQFVVNTVEAPEQAPAADEPAPEATPPERTQVAPPPDAPSSEALARILHIRVPLSVVVAEKPMSLESVLNLGPGVIIEFEKDGDEALDLKVYNRRIGIGEAVKIGENFGIRLLRVDSTRETIRKLGGS